MFLFQMSASFFPNVFHVFIEMIMWFFLFFVWYIMLIDIQMFTQSFISKINPTG